jgi:hypothetical protein
MTQRLGGIPVYKDGSAKEQVGLMAGGNVGFVPNVLIPRLADLNACGVKLGIAFGPDGIPLDALCTELLHESGYPISFLQGHGY